jgi:hypothetical protein
MRPPPSPLSPIEDNELLRPIFQTGSVPRQANIPNPPSTAPSTLLGCLPQPPVTTEALQFTTLTRLKTVDRPRRKITRDRKYRYRLIKGQQELTAFGFKKLSAVPKSIVDQEAQMTEYSGSLVSTAP